MYSKEWAVFDALNDRNIYKRDTVALMIHGFDSFHSLGSNEDATLLSSTPSMTETLKTCIGPCDTRLTGSTVGGRWGWWGK